MVMRSTSESAVESNKKQERYSIGNRLNPKEEILWEDKDLDK